MLKLWILAVCLTLAWTEKEGRFHIPPDGIKPEPQFPRCEKLVCFETTICDHGYVLDNQGCPICQCYENPCEGVICEGDLHCTHKNCRFENCADERHTCVSTEELQRCNRETCTTPCPHGYVYDANRCRTCECQKSPCEGQNCTYPEICTPIDCHVQSCAEHHYECKVQTCPVPMCTEHCEYGLVKDIRGCETCQCRHPPSVDPMTTSNKLCEYNKRLLENLKNEMEEHGRLPEAVKRHMVRHVECNEDGTFKPKQCDGEETSCWCVDDRGIELPSTRVDVTQNEHPECEYHVTKELMLEMVLFHQYDNVEDHYEPLKSAVKSHMSEWMNMAEEHIEVVIAHGSSTSRGLQVKVTLYHDDKTDMNFQAQKFLVDASRHQHVIECPEGGQLTVDTHHISLNYDSHAVYSGGKGYPEKDGEDSGIIVTCGRLWKEKRPVVIVAVFGITVFLLVILGLVISICKKKRNANAQFKHAKMDKYKENLAFQNDVLKHEPEKVKVVVEIEKQEQPTESKY